MAKPKIIALYLPQYHPTPHNDEWWGKGFTEWTNVAKAKKLFRSHYQPHVPADLGFYDLRVPEVREQQVELAKEAGVSAFCYYHYWFGDGHLELERPFKEVVASGKPDFPFCLCWANEDWGAKMWNADGTVAKRRVLAEQKYLGAEDNKKHFEYLLKAFKDKRYEKADGRLIFMIYRPLKFKGIQEFMKQWNELAKANDLPGFFFIGYSADMSEEYDELSRLGLDAIMSCGISEPYYDGKKRTTLRKTLIHLKRKLLNRPTIIPYKKAMKHFHTAFDEKKEVFPTLIPNWDHTPRSGIGGYLFQDSTPELFQQHAEDILRMQAQKKDCLNIVFLKSWNEWGEGNYMEPDLKYGKGHIEALRSAIESMKNE